MTDSPDDEFATAFRKLIADVEAAHGRKLMTSADHMLKPMMPPPGVGDRTPVLASTHDRAVRVWRDLAVLANSLASTIADEPWADGLADDFAWMTAEKMIEARGALFAFRASRGCGGEG